MPHNPSRVSESPIKRVAILFAGGPVPTANAVISTAAEPFLRAGIEVLGIQHGYSHLVDVSPVAPLRRGRKYARFGNLATGRKEPDRMQRCQKPGIRCPSVLSGSAIRTCTAGISGVSNRRVSECGPAEVGVNVR